VKPNIEDLSSRSANSTLFTKSLISGIHRVANPSIPPNPNPFHPENQPHKT
jgi:hypothetical protein